LLKSLVAIPSVNPVDTEDPSISGEKAMGVFLESFLADRGFRVERHEQEPDRFNVIGRYGPEEPARTCMVEAHMDTVSVSGMTRPPFEPSLEDDRLYGRGACDTKGPMAAALHALDPETLEQAASAGWQICFVGAIDEEKGAKGAIWLADQGIGADRAIILEPTDLAVVHAHKGTLWIRITLNGVPGHGSEPEKGINAIEGMARLVERLREDMQTGLPENPVLGRPTLNIGKIEGGSGVNIIAGECRMEVDRRLLPEEDPEQILASMRNHCEVLQTEGALAAYQVELGRQMPPFETSCDSPLIRELLQACEGSGIDPCTTGSPWYSDAGPLSATCKDIVVFGPGSIAQAHTRDEYIQLDALQKGSDILRAYLRNMKPSNDE
jgi:acetylornithine deacetylase